MQAQMPVATLIFSVMFAAPSIADAATPPADEPESKQTVLVTFDDGEQVRAWRYSSPPAHEVVGSLASQYETLARDAATSGDIAFALSRALRVCHQAPTSEEDIGREIAQLRQGAPLLADGTQASAGEKERSVNRIGTYLLELCKGVTAEQKAKADFWLAKAAELGDPIASLNYAAHLGSTPEARSFLEAAWLAGEGDALPNLARLYDDGRAQASGTPDRVQAYAHQYLYVRLMEGMTLPTMGPLRAKWLASAKAVLQSIEPKLSAAERARAAAQAKAMLKANANCCQPL
jgi:hypothetical protein